MARVGWRGYQYITLFAFFCISLFAHKVRAEKECTNFNIDKLIENSAESVEAVERLQELKKATSHFFSYKTNATECKR